MTDVTLAEANERLLVRLGFDLHDGPLQQVHVLAQDVRLLRDQIERLLDGESRKAVLGCFSDLESQLGELHRDLRDLAHSLEPRALLEESLPDAVARELAVFERRADISTSLTLEGSFDALYGLAANRLAARAPGGAQQRAPAQPREVGGRHRYRRRETAPAWRFATTDTGFEPETGAPGEAESGLGLVGMRERLRLLGGGLELTSRRGGPTTLVATLSRWHAAAD